MFSTILATIAAISIINYQGATVKPEAILASHQMSLEDRYQVPSVNNVFKENILLSLAYLRGISKETSVDWNEVNKPFHFVLTLKPGDVFAFHDSVLPEYRGKEGFTTHAHFNSQQGFLSDGYLFGDGVCHLASLIYWVAKDAGLDALAPTSHDFANIPDVPKKYGVAIYYAPGEDGTSARENLYVTNNKDKNISFIFDY
ncbi:MAG: VanW family protein, partial [Patescibacteria group bacterium]|nr:VanW family protein [Patescibacteria group bacterium]